MEDWYLSQCDGDWEHGYGIKIVTLDNPGWSVSINLQETTLENKPFESWVKERTEHDWIHCRLKEGYFEARCGPQNLGEILLIFKDWVEHGEL